MARKAVVDRETVLQLLREGHSSRSIGERFGVSRQAIDLYRKQFIAAGLIETPPHPTSALTTNHTRLPGMVRENVPLGIPERRPTGSTDMRYVPARGKLLPISLDELVDKIIEAFSALKRVQELETELARLKKSYAEIQQQLEDMKAREQKRRDQEQRWLRTQQTGIMTYDKPTE